MTISLFNSACALSGNANLDPIAQDDFYYQVEETRRALLNYYNSQTMTHGGYMIALAVGFTTLISRWTKFKDSNWAWFIIILLVSLIITSGFYILMRTRLYGYLANSVMRIELKVESVSERTLMNALHTRALWEVYEDHWELPYFRSLTVAWVLVVYVLGLLFSVLFLSSLKFGMLKISPSKYRIFKRTSKNKQDENGDS